MSDEQLSQLNQYKEQRLQIIDAIKQLDDQEDDLKKKLVKDSTVQTDLDTVATQRTEFKDMLKEIDEIIQLTKAALGIEDDEKDTEPSNQKRKNDDSDASNDSGYESVDDMFSSKSDKPSSDKSKKQKTDNQESSSDSEEDEPKRDYEFDELERSVEVIGSNAPSPISTFNQVFPPQLLAALTRAGFKKPTIVQKYAVPMVLAKRDLIAVVQTGSGKTGAYLLPFISALLSNPKNFSRPKHYTKCFPYALILAPTRELAVQIHTESEKFTYDTGVKTSVIYGGVDYTKQSQDIDILCDILIATPGRLLDMCQREKVSLSQIKYLCLDEADRMLDMGFEKDMRQIVLQRGMPKERQTAMFSATFPVPIQRLAADFMNNTSLFIKVGKAATTKAITQTIKYVHDKEKGFVVVKDLNAQTEGKALVFVERKATAKYLAGLLEKKGFYVTSIHGNRTQAEREQALESFRKGTTNVLVATDVAARGLDVPDVQHVINYDLPENIEDYIHRIGRTGRVGNVGLATSYFNHKNKKIFADLEEILKSTNQQIPAQFYQVWEEAKNPNKNVESEQ